MKYNKSDEYLINISGKEALELYEAIKKVHDTYTGIFNILSRFERILQEITNDHSGC
jgi:hypothetical protein